MWNELHACIVGVCVDYIVSAVNILTDEKTSASSIACYHTASMSRVCVCVPKVDTLQSTLPWTVLLRHTKRTSLSHYKLSSTCDNNI